MLQLGESKNRILQELNNAGDKGRSFKDLLMIPGMFPSNLSKFLKRLQDPSQSLVERDVNTRKYRILEAGEEALKRRDDIVIISRTKRSFSRELKPSNEVVAPRVLPVQASIYLNEQIAAAADMIAREQGLSEPEVQKQILAELAEGTAYAFEQMLNEKFHRLVDDSRVYRVQQMPRNKRRDHLSKVHPGWPGVRLNGALLDHVEAEYMKEKFPEGGPNMTLEDLLDFEAALVVRISHASIMKDLQGIKNRFVMRILADIKNPELSTDPNEIMPVMGQLGLITPSELEEYAKAAGTKRGRERVLDKLWEAYHERAWHKKYEKF